MPPATTTNNGGRLSSRFIFPFLSRLRHGLVRELDNGRVVPCLYVPIGYPARDERFVERSLAILGLSLPRLLLVVAESTERYESNTEAALQDTSAAMLQCSVDFCAEVEAWILPQNPACDNARAIAARVSADTVVLGLMEADEKARQFVADSMGPVGQPATRVTAVASSFQLPNVSHLIVFESADELQSFRDHLLSLVPDLTLGFGSLSKRAKEVVYLSASSGAPVALIRRTGLVVENLCAMLSHVAQELDKMRLDYYESARTRGPSKLPPLANTPDEDLNQFIDDWPETYDADAVVMADPLTMTPLSFKNRLMAATSAAFCMREVKEDALVHVWSYHDMLLQRAREYQLMAHQLHIAYISGILLAIVASVMYAHVYGAAGQPSLDDVLQLTVFGSTIALPFVVTALKAKLDKDQPTASCAALQVALGKLESETFQFRAQTLVYSASSNGADTDPIATFLLRIDHIMSGVSDLLPSNYPPVIAKAPAGIISEPDDDVADEEAPATEATPMLTPKRGYSWRWKKVSRHKYALVETADTTRFEPLTIHEYLQVRVRRYIRAIMDESAATNLRNQAHKNLVKVITASTSVLAILSLQWLIPIVLGITSFIDSNQVFSRYDQRLASSSATLAELESLQRRWSELPIGEKLKPETKDHLIVHCETAILSGLMAALGTAPKSEELSSAK